jgi:hypothetical protein
LQKFEWIFLLFAGSPLPANSRSSYFAVGDRCRGSNRITFCLRARRRPVIVHTILWWVIVATVQVEYFLLAHPCLPTVVHNILWRVIVAKVRDKLLSVCGRAAGGRQSFIILCGG